MAENPIRDEVAPKDPTPYPEFYTVGQRATAFVVNVEQDGIIVDADEYAHLFVPSEKIDTDTPLSYYNERDMVRVEIDSVSEDEVTARLVQDRHLGPYREVR